MNIEDLRTYCLALPYVEERFPFDDTTLVFCIGGHMFALVDLEHADRVNLKCKPDVAVELRERYEGVVPGWHMNKKHWNTVYLQADVPTTVLHEMIDNSYHLVYGGLPKRDRESMPL